LIRIILFYQGYIFCNKTCDEIETYIPEGEVTQNTEATIDEILIDCVAQRSALYDYRLPLSERTMIKKNALWKEICNVMGGTKLCNY